MRIRTIAKRAALVAAGLFVVGAIALTIAYFRSSNACDQPKAAVGTPMKAIVYCSYGEADVLRLEDVEKPVPEDDQLLVRVRAASVNPLDWHFMRGTPYLMRAQAGLRKPKSTRLGVDFAGTVEAVGRKVTKYKVGDDVFGGRSGALARYVCVREDGAVARKPATVTFEQAAGAPIAGVTALQALRDRAKVRAGQSVLINGASGGVGTFAVQIAKVYGAQVTGVCSTRNLDLVRSIGADRVIDYTKQDFASGDATYDAMLDNVGNRSLFACRHVLKEKGRYVLIGGGGPSDNPVIGPFARVLNAYVLSKFVSQDMGMFLADLNAKDLQELGTLMERQYVKPVIDRQFDIRDSAQAIRYLEEGHARGKVIVTME